MGTSTLLQSMFRHKAWANEELFAELAKVDPVAHAAERQAMCETDPAPSLASLLWISRPDETGTQSLGRGRDRVAPASDDLRIRFDVWNLRGNGFHAGSERERE